MMQTLIIKNKGLNGSTFETAFARLQDYTAHCYFNENYIVVHYEPTTTFSVDVGREVDGITATKLAIRHYLKDYLHGIEIA